MTDISRKGAIRSAKRIARAFIALAALSLPSAAICQGTAHAEERMTQQGGGAVKSISMGAGKSIFYDLPADAAEIFVGSPKIANVIIRSPRKLYIVAVTTGQTSVTALDRDGREIVRLEVQVGQDASALEELLKLTLPRSNIRAKSMNQSMVLLGEVASASDAATAMDLAKAFVKKNFSWWDSFTTSANGTDSGQSGSGVIINAMTVRAPNQVMIKLTVAEMNRNVMKQLGVSTAMNGSEVVAKGSWGVLQQSHDFNVNGLLSDSRMSINNTFGGNVTLRAYERHGVSRILAEPTVTAVSGKEAKFTVGGEVAYSSSSSCTGYNCSVGVAYKPYGISLNVTPVVISEGRILLTIKTDITEIDPTRSIAVSGTLAPSFRNRSNSTSVELPSGASIATAGLLSSSSKQAINGLPGLLNLPVLGALFRSRDYQSDESELMIIVTPYLARAVNPADVKRPDDGFLEPSDPQGWLLGRVNKLYSTKSNPQAAENWKGRFGFIQD